MATIDGYYFGICTKGAERRGRAVAELAVGTGLDPADFTRPGWRGSAEAMALLVRNIPARAVAVLIDSRIFCASSNPSSSRCRSISASLMA